MYTCRWLVLCETVVSDRTSNNLTMINAITELHVGGFPAMHPRFAFASLLERQGESLGALSLRFVRETKEKEEVLVNITDKKEAPPRVQFYMVFPLGIRLNEKGKITFRVEVREGNGDWYSVGSQHLQVYVQNPKKDVLPEKTQLQE